MVYLGVTLGKERHDYIRSYELLPLVQLLTSTLSKTFIPKPPRHVSKYKPPACPYNDVGAALRIKQ